MSLVKRPTFKKSPSDSKKLSPKRNEADKFESVARRLGCDVEKARFEEKLGKIAKAKPKTGK